MQPSTPHSLRPEEWDEIAALDIVREAWGLNALTADDPKPGTQLSTLAYGARFDFVSGGPGYAGDLFFIHDDAFGGPPLVLVRDVAGKLETGPYHCKLWPRECACSAT